MPVSFASKAAETGWYSFAVEYVDWKWVRTSGNSRKNTAKAMTAATVALLRTQPGQFDDRDVRTALREFAFNTKRRSAPAPGEVREILDWVERNTLPMSAWEDTAKVEQVVAAISTLLDGTAAAASSVMRNRRILSLALDRAVQHNILRVNPLAALGKRESGLRVGQAISKRSLLNPAQVTALLEWIGQRPRRGLLYQAFFATICYAGLRPEEAVALHVADAVLPETGWGEIIVHKAHPEVGGQWTDSGEVHEVRDLKGRAEGDTRTVPIHPDLVALLRRVIAKYELKPDGLLLPGAGGDTLAGSVYRRVWGKAREAVLAAHEYASPAGKRVYDLRHTCLTGWLNAGVPPATVAEWAGNSVPVLLAIYARCVTGQLTDYLKRIEGLRYLPVA
ncbi:tyrosine-type recombinase/integrase [Streptomyces aculeolatus]|uniref:tyrosine-type recombinase/integrase n=1 Tax=Streptomyces aculeolatus TaxID=270689 RepID=UPI001CEDB878|nr:tyrosine-type recombinase/integrase [Streptomyces aculeolatus]